MPVTSVTSAATPISGVFPVRAITHVQSRKFDDVIDVADTFMAMLDGKKFPNTKSGRIKSGTDVTTLRLELSLKLNRDALITAQQNDLSLTPCFSSAVTSPTPKSQTLIKALIKFLSTFGLPKIVQIEKIQKCLRRLLMSYRLKM